MGDQQGSATVIAGQTSTGHVMLYLQGKEVPGRDRAKQNSCEWIGKQHKNLSTPEQHHTLGYDPS